jgi:uncharacterized metal-binding protein YceD (DUF177 family)
LDYLSQYIIPFKGLDNTEYCYSFQVEDKFFEFFEKSLIKGGKIDVELNLTKRSHSLTLDLTLKGFVQLECDRCLELYDQEIHFNNSINVELGDETNFDVDEDFVLLDRNESEINISQFIYEFAHFALPFSHFHPLDKDGKSKCDPKMLELLSKHAQPEIEKVDPRWEKLNELKNKI